MERIPFGGPPASPGTVYLVGGGPGDPGLLGLRAARLLSTADVVAYDRLAPAEALELCPDGCERIYVGKGPRRHALSQDEINELLLERARGGAAVVRFKGGDPFVLGRGSEEAQACVAANVPFEVVPAVTAGIAAPAYAGIPVTHRGLAPGFAVVTGHEDPTKPDSQVDYDALARFPGTLLLYMGVGRLEAICRSLVAAGKPTSTPVAVVASGSTPQQRTVVGTLADVADRVAESGVSNPAMIVVGEVVALREELSWFEQRPLHGRSVLVPRSRHQAGALSARLRALGASVVEAPTIAIEPPADPQALAAALAAAADGAYDWMALTSANGVNAVFEFLGSLGLDARALASVRVAAVGPGTADALAERGIRADLVASRHTAGDLASELSSTGEPGRVLLPLADIAGPVLGDALAAAGWAVERVEAYRNVPVTELPDGVREALLGGEVDVVAFPSSSTARNLLALLGPSGLPAGVRVASIGPSTSQTCRDLGLRVDAEADPHDIDGLVKAVLTAAGA